MFFIWLVFSALFCFYAAGARGLERLEKKREGKRLGKDAYFVSARTFSFQDPSLLLSSGQPRENEWLSRQHWCKVRKLSFFPHVLTRACGMNRGKYTATRHPWRSPTVRAKYVNSKKVALEILRMFVLNFYEPLLDTSMKSNVRHQFTLPAASSWLYPRL